MSRNPACDGVAAGHADCVVAVRLRLSITDRLIGVLRWTLGLVATVAVLWLGGAFLATPVAAAAVPAAAGAQSPAKAGKSGKGGSGKEKKSGESGKKPAEKKGKADKPEKDKPAKGDKGDKPNKGDKPDKGDKPEKGEKQAKEKKQAAKDEKPRKPERKAGKERKSEKPKQARDREAGERSDGDREDAGRKIREAVREKVREAVEDSRERIAETEKKAQKVAAEKKDGKAKQAPATPPKAVATHDGRTTTKAKQDAEKSTKQAVSTLGARSPPADEDDEDDESGDDEDSDEDEDSAEQTERALQDRIAVEKSAKKLTQSKKDVASGKKTKAEYAEEAAAHKKVQQRYQESRSELSDDRADLVDEVTDGHKKLDSSEKKLAAEKKKVASGEVTAATYRKHAAALEEQRDEVYDATEELMDATDRDVDPVSEDDLDGPGAVSGCDSDGAFTGCGAAAESGDGKRDSQEKLCLSGISSGCGVSAAAGDAKASADCDDAGCRSSATGSGVDGSRGKAAARCTGLGCGEFSRVERGDDDDGGVTAVVEVDCDAGCTGSGETSTEGRVTTKAMAGKNAPVRTTKAGAKCAVTGGGCSAAASSRTEDDVTEGDDRTVAVRHELSAASSASSQTSCATSVCKASASSTTSGAATGDVKGVRDSTATSSCAAHGSGGDCTTEANTAVADRHPGTGPTVIGVRVVSGPVSTSDASAQVRCSDGATACGGTATSATSARDTAVTPEARGTSATSTCAVTGGDCTGDTTSAASSAPDHVAVDPNTGLPLRGQPLAGPSSTSTASASLTCDAGCSGTVTTTTKAWDGAVANGKPRTSTSTASCAGGTADCQVQAVSTASTGPGAAVALSGSGVPVNAARLVAGPSSASAAGATLTCEGDTACTGKASSAASAVNPSVVSIRPGGLLDPRSGDARGSRSTGACTGVSGGVCQAVTNSGASSEPNATIISPLVQARSTGNATVATESTGEQQPTPTDAPQGSDVPAAPAPAAPGSSANSGGPTVPGASSWTMASATLACAAGTPCTGTARTSATGDDGVHAQNRAGGARGPPAATGGTLGSSRALRARIETSTSSGSCTTSASGCHAQTDSTAGSGQVVADIIAEQRNDPAAKPVTDAPATMAQSTATAECAGPGCTAATTGGTSGVPGTTTTTARCTAAAHGCAVASDVTATVVRNAGQEPAEAKSTKKAGTLPGVAGQAQASSQIDCPEAGCTGTLTGTVDATAGPEGRRSTSTATGSTGCDGTTACRAQIGAASSVTRTASTVAPEKRFATTTAQVSATCDNGTAAGCATRTASTSDAVGAAKVTGRATAGCRAAGSCRAETGGFAAPDIAEVTAGCTGTGCRTHTSGKATAAAPGGVNRAASGTACTAGANGQCAGTSRVGATESGTQVAASCSGSKGATCRYHYAARSTAHSAAAGNRATATAACGDRGGSGSGWCGTSAAAKATAESAMAAASCQGSKGSGCHYSYRAESHASAPGAQADAVGFGAGRTGGGQVMTSAAAAGTGSSAQASASCMGSAGTHCRHSYSASRSASASDPATGSHAWARASGSGGGGMGGGGVAVSVSAYAEGNNASASASCSGAANCDAPFYAEAKDSRNGPEQSATWHNDGGYHSAWKTAECSGNNGGCGVTAIAIPGQADGGDAYCSGYCANFSQNGANSWIKTVDAGWKRAQAAGVEIDPKTHEPVIDPKTGRPKLRGIGDNRYGAEFKCDGNQCQYRYRDLGDKTDGTWHTCAKADCAGQVGTSGQKLTVGKNGDLVVNNPTAPGGTTYDTATDPKEAGSYRDDQGRGMGWAATTGSIKDAYSGSTVTGKGGGVTASYGDPKGGPFVVSCPNGCSGELRNGKTVNGKPVVDTFDIGGPNGTKGADAWLMARDQFGLPAVANWNGAGRFTSFEGVTMVTDGPVAAPPPLLLPSTQPQPEPGLGRATVVTAGRGNPHGTYAMYGQGGYVQLPDGRKIENKVETGGTLSPDQKSTIPFDTCMIISSCATPKPVSEYQIVVSTPDAQGKGGSFDCYGHCAETLPANLGVDLAKNCTKICDPAITGLKSVDPTKRACTAVCALHDEFAGNEGSKTPNGYFSVQLDGPGQVYSFTPQGDAQYCSGAGCGFVQGYRDANGNGGFGVCTGIGAGQCIGETNTADGTHKTLMCAKVSCSPTVLGYPNPDKMIDTDGDGTLDTNNLDKYGPNDGWSCGNGASANGCTGGDPGTMVKGRGEADPSWMLLLDPSYTRSSTGSPVDKKIKEDLTQPIIDAGQRQLDKEKKLVEAGKLDEATYQRHVKDHKALVKQLNESDQLPPLDPSSYDALSAEDKKRYDAAVRPLTLVEKAFAEARVVAAESNAQYVKDRGNKELPGLNTVLDKIEQNRPLSAGDQKLLDSARTRFPLLDVDRGIVNGLDQMDYQRLLISAKNQSVADPGLSKYFDGKSRSTIRTELQNILHVDAQGRQLDAQGRVIVSSEQEGKALPRGTRFHVLSPEQQVQGNAAGVVNLAMVGHKEDIRLRTLAFEGESAAFKVAKAGFDRKNAAGTATQAEADALNAMADRLNAMQDGIVKDTDDLVVIGDYLKAQPALPGYQLTEKDFAALRAYDFGFADNANDPTWAAQLRKWDTFQTRATNLEQNLERSRGADDPLTKDIGLLAATAGLNYDTVLRDVGSRSADNKLFARTVDRGTDLLQLPSTGRPDMINVLTSGINKPAYDDITDRLMKKYFDEGVAGDPFAGESAADRRAEFASRGTPQEVMNSLSMSLTKAEFDKLDDDTKKGIKKFSADGSNTDVVLALYEDPDTHKLQYMPMYQVIDGDGSVKAIIDVKGHHYDSLTEFRDDNELFNEGTKMLTPDDLGNRVGDLDFTTSDAKHVKHKWLDRTMMVVSFVGAALMFVGGTAFGAVTLGLGAPVTAAMYAGGVALTAAGFTYFVGRGVENWNTRASHGQSNNVITNPAARADALNIVSSGLFGLGFVAKLGAGAAAAAGATRTAAFAGGSAKVLNGGAMAGFGAMFVEGGYHYARNFSRMSGEDRFWDGLGLGMNAVMFGMAGAQMTGRTGLPKWSKGAGGPGLFPSLRSLSPWRVGADRPTAVTPRPAGEAPGRVGGRPAGVPAEGSRTPPRGPTTTREAPAPPRRAAEGQPSRPGPRTQRPTRTQQTQTPPRTTQPRAERGAEQTRTQRTLQRIGQTIQRTVQRVGQTIQRTVQRVGQSVQRTVQRTVQQIQRTVQRIVPERVQRGAQRTIQSVQRFMQRNLPSRAGIQQAPGGGPVRSAQGGGWMQRLMNRAFPGSAQQGSGSPAGGTQSGNGTQTGAGGQRGQAAGSGSQAGGSRPGIDSRGGAGERSTGGQRGVPGSGQASSGSRPAEPGGPTRGPARGGSDVLLPGSGRGSRAERSQDNTGGGDQPSGAGPEQKNTDPTLYTDPVPPRSEPGGTPDYRPGNPRGPPPASESGSSPRIAYVRDEAAAAQQRQVREHQQRVSELEGKVDEAGSAVEQSRGTSGRANPRKEAELESRRRELAQAREDLKAAEAELERMRGPGYYPTRLVEVPRPEPGGRTTDGGTPKAERPSASDTGQAVEPTPALNPGEVVGGSGGVRARQDTGWQRAVARVKRAVALFAASLVIAGNLAAVSPVKVASAPAPRVVAEYSGKGPKVGPELEKVTVNGDNPGTYKGTPQKTRSAQPEQPRPEPEQPHRPLLMPIFTTPVFDIRLVWETGQVVNPALSDAAVHRFFHNRTLRQIDNIGRPIHLSQRQWNRMVDRAYRVEWTRTGASGLVNPRVVETVRAGEVRAAWAEHRRLVGQYAAAVGEVRAARDAALAQRQEHWENRVRELGQELRDLRRKNAGVLRWAGLRPQRGTPDWQRQRSTRAAAERVQAQIAELESQIAAVQAEADRVAGQRETEKGSYLGIPRPSQLGGLRTYTPMMDLIAGLNALFTEPDPVTGARMSPEAMDHLLARTGREWRTRSGLRRLGHGVEHLRDVRSGREGSRGELAADLVAALRDGLDDLVRGGIRWLTHPPDGTVRGARERAAIARELGLPRELVDAIADDPSVSADNPAGLGGHPERFRSFRIDLELVRAAIEQKRLASPRVEELGPPGPASRNPDASLNANSRPGFVTWRWRAYSSTLARGPPSIGMSGWWGAGRALRKAVRNRITEWRRLADANTEVRRALAVVHATRARFEHTAGGLRAFVDGTATPVPELAAAELAAAHRVLAAALKERREAEAELAAALRYAVRDASRAGLSHRGITAVTGLSADTVATLAGPWHADQERFPTVDAINTRLMRWFNRGAEFGLPDGRQVTVGWLREQLGDEGRFLVVLKDGEVVELVGRTRTAHYDESDGHFHPAGYDHSRPPKVAGLLTQLRDAGHQGVVTFHFIPQHGKGFAPLGATFYYLVNSVLNVAFWAGTPMLQMWGAFSDVRLAHEVRNLAPSLRWRAVVGTTGARMDIAGARAYLRLFTLFNPDVAGMIGETTIAKEAVTKLLGPQAIHTVNPVWRVQVDRLVAAAGILRTAVAEGRITAGGLPDGLREMITGGAERDATQLLPVLLEHVDAIRGLLRKAGKAKAARSLFPESALSKVGLYNPHLRELFAAVEEQGHLIVIHNDFGLARTLADSRYIAEKADGRYGMPLLALLRQYPRAKVVLAHMGMGKFTEPTTDHVELWGRIFDDPGLRHVSTDISWNEVARHLQKTPAITDAFVALARRHHDRIIFGTDAVKPESLSQYFRQAYDIDPVLDRVRAEVGEQAYRNIRHANLERLLVAAHRDVHQWAYVQLRSGAWDEVLARLPAEHRRVIDEWLLRYEAERDERTLARPDAEIPVTTPGRWTDRHDVATAQLRNLLRWHGAVTPEVVNADKLITGKLAWASLLASWEDHVRAAARRSAERAARRALPGAHDTTGLGLVDAAGNPYPVDALVAADQAGHAFGDRETTGHVLRETARTQRDQDAADQELRRERTRFWIKAGLGAGVVVGVVAVGAPLLTVSTTVSYTAFALRGALNLYRTAYAQQVRVMTESILERSQFDPNTIDVLVAKTRKYAILSGAGPARMQRLDKVTTEFRAEVARIAERWDAIGHTGSAAEIQKLRDEALAAFSVLLDKVGVHSGVQYQSYPSISADAGVLGRTVNTALALTFGLHFLFHLQQALATGGLSLAVNATYAAADLLFLVQAGPAMVTGWAGRDVASHHPVVRKVVHLLALPTITAANALLSVQLALSGDLVLVVPALVLTATTGYLTKLGLAVELGLGRIAPRKGAGANAWMSAALLAFGVFGLLPAHWPVVVFGLFGSVALLAGLSKFDTWLSRRARAPPPAGPGRDATDADLARIRAEALVHPDGLGVVLAPPGDPLRAVGLELRGQAGETVLVMHGGADGFGYPTPEGTIRVSAEQVADLLDDLLPGRPHRLNVCACAAGARPEEGARTLSSRLGVTVVAPRDTVLVHRPGAFGARVTTDGGWVRVDAGRPAEAAPAPEALVSPRTVVDARRIGPPGVVLPIAPRAPPVPAHAGVPSARLRELADRAVAEHVAKKLRTEEQRQSFRDDPEGFLGKDWVGAALGDVVEGRVADVLAEYAQRHGLTVLRGVEMEFRKSSGAGGGRIDEIDFLLVDERTGPRMVVSAKANPRQFRRSKDQHKLDLLMRDIPAGPPEQLRAWVRTELPGTSERRLADLVAVDVRWDGSGRPISLGQFRREYLKGATDPETVLIEGASPAAQNALRVVLPETRARILADIEAAIHRHIRRATGGNPSQAIRRAPPQDYPFG